ncbi:MAG: L,D-transpeptidase family protein [Rhodomicrobium sp.]
MIRRLIFAFGVVAASSIATVSAGSEQPAGMTAATAVPAATPASKSGEMALSPSAIPAPASPYAEAMRAALSGVAAGDTDEERNEHTALASFYEARAYAPLWLTPEGSLTPKASLVTAEVKRAGESGLDPRDFPLPAVAEPRAAAGPATPEKVAAAEIKISLAVLKYGRYARGGRIINPSEQLSSYLDRRPQLLKPQSILDGIAEAGEPDAYLRGLNPAHPQFEKLRQKYLALSGSGKKSSEAKKLLANMEEWRWMPADMGSVYIWNNIPEFTQRVVKNGEVIRKERIVAGETGKQTPIFSRPLKKVTFKPTWIVPDSIKVRELWPSLLRGGGLMRQWALEVRTKEGKPVNWRKVNWSTADIREYDVIQPNGPKTVLGKVKFSFPSQHTVFMHDTRQEDKWMFNVAQRTYSHGCMRVADPMGLAKIALREDKGWDAAHVMELFNKGPLNNEIVLDRKIPVHMTYFTAFVDDDGKLHTFSDVYGHERRITLALEGKWDRIVRGRDHLAPVELDLANAHGRHYAEEDSSERVAPFQRERHASGGGGFFESIFGDYQQ